MCRNVTDIGTKRMLLKRMHSIYLLESYMRLTRTTGQSLIPEGDHAVTGHNIQCDDDTGRKWLFLRHDDVGQFYKLTEMLSDL